MVGDDAFGSGSFATTTSNGTAASIGYGVTAVDNVTLLSASSTLPAVTTDALANGMVDAVEHIQQGS